jgi:hypothetical protein
MKIDTPNTNTNRATTVPVISPACDDDAFGVGEKVGGGEIHWWAELLHKLLAHCEFASAVVILILGLGLIKQYWPSESDPLPPIQYLYVVAEQLPLLHPSFEVQW